MGRPKHLLPFGNEVVLQRIVRATSQVCTEVVLVAAKNQELPDIPECRILRDEAEYQGPLYGLHYAMQALKESTDLLYLTSCDVPLLAPEFVRAIWQRIGSAEIAVVTDGEFYHPLAAVYRTSLSERIEQLIDQGEHRPRALFECSQTVRVALSELRMVDPELDSLKNMNMPADYYELLERAGLRSSTAIEFPHQS